MHFDCTLNKSMTLTLPCHDPDPTYLEAKDGPHGDEDDTNARDDDRPADEIPEESTLPGRVYRLYTTSDGTPGGHTL